MKISEVENGLSIALTNEEAELLDKFGDDAVTRKQLSDREQLLANQLVVKDLLIRKQIDGKTHYKKI